MHGAQRSWKPATWGLPRKQHHWNLDASVLIKIRSIECGAVKRSERGRAN